jgi:tetratricopeptide (TPR) repeat protein
MKALYSASLFFAVLIILPSFSADKTELNAQGVKACERGEYKEGVGLFIDALKLAPNDQTIAKNLAGACRTLAARRNNHGDMENAIAALRQGLAYLPREASLRKDLVVVLVNQGAAFLNNKDYARAQQAASEALQLDNENPLVNSLAGDIAYARQDLAAARGYWQAALNADPANENIAHRMKQLQKEQNAERTFSKMEAYHFDIRFDYQTLAGGVCDIRKFLMEAYEKVGQDFELFPEYPIVVILYKENEFRMVNNVPEYVAGLYDGKIRVPVNYTRYPLATLKGILFHEYTHAVIHDLAGPGCPVWLNEGIAMREMNDQLPVASEALRRAMKQGTLLSLDQLGDPGGAWRDPNRVPLAYAQSWIMADYLFSRWSNRQIKNVLLRIKQGSAFSAVLQEYMNRTPAQFDEEWKAFARGKVL